VLDTEIEEERVIVLKRGKGVLQGGMYKEKI